MKTMRRQHIAIQLTNIGKKYDIHHERPMLVEALAKNNPFSGRETFWALRNINLTIKQGEIVGIIGANGSGKTTLLKIIAGITQPTEGVVVTAKHIAPLIDLEAGFHPDLTGEQNIYINGMILGMSKKHITSNLHRIISFADIGQFIDAPLRMYSSGMRLRLGFSIAVHASPTILLLDEAMAVGDISFQRKAYKKIQEFKKKKKTMIFVSHQGQFIKERCHRVIIIDKGKIIEDGPSSVIDKYM